MGQDKEEQPICKALKSARFPLLMAVRDSGVAVEWALAFLGCMRQLAKKPCIALDIDGTVILNVKNGPTRCVKHFQALVGACADYNITVFCITARTESHTVREYTTRQLEKCSLAPISHVYMRPKDADYASYKHKAREHIAKRGFTILLTVGDQWADISFQNPPSELLDTNTYVGQLSDNLQFCIKLPSEFA